MPLSRHKITRGRRRYRRKNKKSSEWGRNYKIQRFEKKKIKREISENIETAFTDARYGYIEGALKETYVAGHKDTLKKTHTIDNIVTHKIWGYPIFLLFMFIMFEATFAIGQYPMDWIDWCIGKLSDFINNNMSDGPLKDLLTQGIIGGVGSVIVFLPNILILYFFISIMEDTGYMARAAFIMDKFMHKMGLHGKSFIPLVIGFGCNVPAIMATRTIESRKTRLLTILVNSLMSCSARLTIYLLFIGTFFGNRGGMILFLLYFSGIFLAIVMCRLFKKFLVKGEDLPFVMELPPYRIPTGKSILIHMWEKASQYLKKMGGIILIASILIWFLEYFPINNKRNQIYNKEITKIETQYEGQKSAPAVTAKIESVEKKQRANQQESSYIGRFGKFIEPIFRPLGFNWKMCVSLISGMAAKEIVVSTLGILYVGDSGNDSALTERLATEKNADGTPAYTPLVVLSFMFFVLIYFPCIATIAAIKNETGSWKWAIFVVFYTTALAWLVSFTIFQVGRLLI